MKHPVQSENGISQKSEKWKPPMHLIGSHEVQKMEVLVWVLLIWSQWIYFFEATFLKRVQLPLGIQLILEVLNWSEIYSA